MNVVPLLLLFTFACVHTISAHSMMTFPQATTPSVCYLGGDPEFNVGHCPGPCNLKAIRGGYSNFGSPDNPSAVYHRGQRIRIKYQRNNHGPGGFLRLTIVPPRKIMHKGVHARNAFHFSCWGANVHVVTRAERVIDRWGFSLVGNDGQNHRYARAYYETFATIPDVIPDGKYVLGWAWYGGTGGTIEGNRRVQRPQNKGYFSDYWSCAFVQVKGGSPLKQKYRPVFQNDMRQFSERGCMAANDAPGICVYEPCKKEARFQKPRQFKNGRVPPFLTPRHFT